MSDLEPRDPYVDDGEEDRDDREAQGYYDSDEFWEDYFQDHPEPDSHHDTREEERGER